MADTHTPVAYCTWLDRMGPIGSKERGWHRFDGAEFVRVRYDDYATLPAEHVCRASVGERVITVWLPRGTMIRFRRPRAIRDNGRYTHVYGRDNDKGIHVYIPEAVTQ